MTEPRYILLAEGETTQSGDEYYEAALERWMVFSGVYSGLEIGNVPIRRKLEGWREIKDGSEITFPCVLVFDSGDKFKYSICEDRDEFIRFSGLYKLWHLSHWLPLPPLPAKQSEAEIAWAEHCETHGKQANDHTFTRAGFLAGFEAGRKK